MRIHAAHGVFVLVALMLAAAAAGCAQSQVAARGRPATAADLECSIEAVGLQPDGGLPAQLKLTVRNKSSEAAVFTLPRPLIGEDTIWQVKEPLVLLGAGLTDKAGHEEAAVYTHPKDKDPAKAEMAALPPGGTWTGTYALTEFYFWGPCGPDTGGAFTKYFWRGDKEISLRAALIFEKENSRVESSPLPIRCSFEDWLFKKNRVD
ncbi:MAG: hypothetical protein NTY65_06640 [Planctomycetota bacterium]|nr:hypothetical protein [Planctomycetota bacterium]